MQVFISYAREDAERVAVLARCLESRGFNVFWDRRILSGERWHEVIGRALGEADRVLVVWSSASVASDFVRDEAAEGQTRRALIPILFDDVLPPLGFRQIQATSFVDWNGDEQADVFVDLVTALGQAGVSSLPTPPHSLSIAAPRVRRERPWYRAPGRWALLGLAPLIVAAGYWFWPHSVDPGSPPSEAEARAVMTAYYRDIDANTFDAKRYFAAQVDQFITMRGTTAVAIGNYVVDELPRTYEGYYAEMVTSPRSLTPYVFGYRELTRHVKDGQMHVLLADVSIRLDPARKIKSFVTHVVAEKPCNCAASDLACAKICASTLH